MFIDLNIPTPTVSINTQSLTKKPKGKAPQQPLQAQALAVTFTPAQLTALESRLDVLEHLGYTVFALNQVVQKKIDAKTHVNMVDLLLDKLRKRENITFLKRLTIVLDEESEKGFGLTTGNLSIVAPYDLIALVPTTSTTFSQACLSHSVPSNLTAHIISLPLTCPRLPFNLKHTMVRTAIKNGAVFEISYVGALGGDGDLALGSEGGASGKRNWWAAAREIVRVTKGKGIIVTSGVTNIADLRAPRDVGNLLTMLDLAQNLAHDASTKTAQSLILRAQTRKTYRAVLSEPTIVIPSGCISPSSNNKVVENPASSSPSSVPEKSIVPSASAEVTNSTPTPGTDNLQAGQKDSKKRPREDDDFPREAGHLDRANVGTATNSSSKKKKKHQGS